MSGILVVAETRRGVLRDVSFELLGAANTIKRDAGLPLVACLVDAHPERFTDELAAEGVDEVLLVPAPTDDFEAHVAERALEALIELEMPSLVIMAHSVDALGVGPAVAARRQLGFASDVTGVAWEERIVASRGAYGEKLTSRLEFPGKDCTLLMLRPGSFEAASGRGGAARRIIEIQLGDAVGSEHISFEEIADSAEDITKAPFLLAVGRGIEDEDNIPRFEQLAERLGATLAVSRPLVDAGWASSARQVGQSGKTVKPRVYLALGISGAVQHLAGIRGADTVIAINTDPEAPIFNAANYGAVTDLFEFAEELERQIQ